MEIDNLAIEFFKYVNFSIINRTDASYSLDYTLAMFFKCLSY